MHAIGGEQSGGSKQNAAASRVVPTAGSQTLTFPPCYSTTAMVYKDSIKHASMYPVCALTRTLKLEARHPPEMRTQPIETWEHRVGERHAALRSHRIRNPRRFRATDITPGAACRAREQGRRHIGCHHGA